MPRLTEGEWMVAAVHYTTVSSPNSRFVNTVAYHATGGIGDDCDLVDACNAVFASWLAAFGALMPTDLNLEKVEGAVVSTVGSLPGPYFESTTAATSFGGSGTILPYQNCAMIRTLSGLTGRHGRHRSYLPGVLVANTTTSKLTTLALASYVAAATAVGFVSAVGGTTVNLSQAHIRFDWNTGQLIEGSDVVQWKGDSIIRCQRRRQPDRGS